MNIRKSILLHLILISLLGFLVYSNTLHAPFQWDDRYSYLAENPLIKDLGYFLKMAEDMGTRAEIAEGTSQNLQAAVAAGMGDGNVPEIFDYFMRLEH